MLHMLMGASCRIALRKTTQSLIKTTSPFTFQQRAFCMLTKPSIMRPAMPRMSLMLSPFQKQFGGISSVYNNATAARSFSVVLKKRPRCVKVNKYKLKTKKPAAKRMTVVSNRSCLTVSCVDWNVEGPRIQVPLAGSLALEPEQELAKQTQFSH